ncbi:tautomerase family protein [Pannonibacter indicus]|nr:tautomerase family protein [Pannonibacter indicus]
MPVTQIFSLPGRSAEEKQLIMECIHEALMTRFDIPHDDQYMIFNEKAREDFFFGSFPEMERSDAFLLIQITVSNTRSVEMKKNLYKAICDKLGRKAGVLHDDVMVSLVEVTRDCWSFGRGIAQYT